MDLQQSRHGCAKIKRGPKGPRRREVNTGVRSRRQPPRAAYFFSTVVSLTEVDPVETGAPGGAGGGVAAAKFGGGLAAT